MDETLIQQALLLSLMLIAVAAIMSALILFRAMHLFESLLLQITEIRVHLRGIEARLARIERAVVRHSEYERMDTKW